VTPSLCSGILAEIVQYKKREVEDLREHMAALERAALERKPSRDFKAALTRCEPAIISELKKASPSKGVLVEQYHPAFLAHAYEEGGASALSVLTDRKYFQGSLHDLEAARAAAALPVLRKDFTVDRLQIYEAAAHGADAILLIAAVLEAETMRQFRELASELQMAALVEIHNADELQKAIDSGAEIIGVNNRNLETFEVDIDTSVRLSYLLPASAVKVSESGIFTHDDVTKLSAAGYNAFLIGESLMRSPDPAAALRTLRGAA
jgi:indole-3-glycerol phosphate synthase